VTGPAVYSSGHFFHVPVVCYLHGIDIIINNFIYKKIFLPSVRRADLVIVNSRNTASLATKTGIKNSAIHVLHPGITLPSHSFLGSDNSEFQCMAQTDNKKILLSVGRLTARKGLIPFIVHCLPKVVAWRDDVVFVIIGGEAHQALNKSVTTHNDILLAARKASMTEHVRVLGHVSDNILSQAYASSDLHVFPVLDLPGDIEGFGTVAVEAASYGLFTAAFASGGVTDAVAHNISGYLIEQGNYEKLSYVIVEHLKKTVTTSQRTKCIDFARQFTWKRCGAHLRQIFSNFLARSE
jgi:phosphatidylinositol alpha-1,6-mannosyltransferase